MSRRAGITAIFTALAPSLLWAETEEEIPLGIEAVTGLRSHYVHRGFELADASLDFQLEAELSLSNHSSLHFGLSHLSESSGDFSETSIYAEYTHDFSDKLLLGSSLTYRDRSSSLLDSGIDLGFFTSYELHKDWRWRNQFQIDFGESGFYFASELEWSQVLSEDAFVTIESGLSLISDYQDRDGLNDFYARVSLTYTLSEQVSFTPFIGASVQLDDHDGSDVAYAGLWFEVIF